MLYRADIMLRPEDFFISIVWLVLILAGAFAFRNSRYSKDDPSRKYFFPALFLKIAGGLGIGAVYLFYYKGGDTASYFLTAYGIHTAFMDSWEAGWTFLSTSPTDYKPGEWETRYTELYYKYVIHYIVYFKDENAYFVSRIIFFATLLTFANYFATSIIISTISFIGVWGLYRTFLYEFPLLRRQLAFAIFFVPSVWFWGSGLLKDSLTFGFLGMLTYCVHQLTLRRKLRPILVIGGLFSFFIIYNIKSYIIFSYVPFILLWIGLRWRENIRNGFIKLAFTPFILIFFSLGAYFALVKLSEGSSKYSIDTVLNTAYVSKVDLTSSYYYSDGKGSSYDIGDFSPTPTGVLSKLPICVITTFFRPFLFESRSVLMLISALENTIILLFFFRLFYRIGIFRFFKLLGTQSVLFFSFGFSISFAFMVGLSSGNFGNLVRYKIPCIPFFLVSLIIMNFLIEHERNRLYELKLKKFAALKAAPAKAIG